MLKGKRWQRVLLSLVNCLLEEHGKAFLLPPFSKLSYVWLGLEHTQHDAGACMVDLFFLISSDRDLHPNDQFVMPRIAESVGRPDSCLVFGNRHVKRFRRSNMNSEGKVILRM